VPEKCSIKLECKWLTAIYQCTNVFGINDYKHKKYSFAAEKSHKSRKMISKKILSIFMVILMDFVAFQTFFFFGFRLKAAKMCTMTVWA
jgi:hypothetical protein